MATYNDLSDEDKLELAIKFVATEQPMPEALLTFLHEADLYDLIVNPMEISHAADSR